MNSVRVVIDVLTDSDGRSYCFIDDLDERVREDVRLFARRSGESFEIDGREACLFSAVLGYGEAHSQPIVLG